MIPKINFRYSWVYDQQWKIWSKNLKSRPKEYPSCEDILDYLTKIEKIWKSLSKKILIELSDVIRLKWHSKEIQCYVVGSCKPFSDPLTIPIYNDKKWFLDVLIHELIHRLFVENKNLIDSKKAWEYLDDKYKEESKIIRVHILLYAIHTHIYLKFFGKDRLLRNIKTMKSHKDYSKSWDIVEKEGYENIIKEFKESNRK